MKWVVYWIDVCCEYSFVESIYLKGGCKIRVCVGWFFVVLGYVVVVLLIYRKGVLVYCCYGFENIII